MIQEVLYYLCQIHAVDLFSDNDICVKGKFFLTKYPKSLMQREYLHPGVSIMSLDKVFELRTNSWIRLKLNIPPFATNDHSISEANVEDYNSWDMCEAEN